MLRSNFQFLVMWKVADFITFLLHFSAVRVKIIKLCTVLSGTGGVQNNLTLGSPSANTGTGLYVSSTGELPVMSQHTGPLPQLGYEFLLHFLSKFCFFFCNLVSFFIERVHCSFAAVSVCFVQVRYVYIQNTKFLQNTLLSAYDLNICICWMYV